MKKNFFLLLFSLGVVFQAFSQIKYEIVPIDSARQKWVIRVFSMGQDGSQSIQQTPPVDSAVAVDQFVRIIEKRSEAAEAEIKLLDEGLKRSAGIDFARAKKDRLAEDLIGSWTITGASQDTISINIGKGLAVTGGTIRGAVTVLDKDNIKLIKVLPSDVEFTREDRNKYTGRVSGKAVILSRAGGPAPGAKK